MKYLVTGGAGFIGSNIVMKLIESGHDVIVYDNFSSGYKRNIVEGCSVIEGDVLDSSMLDSAIKNCDRVIHLAASVGNKRSIDSPVLDASINLIGTINVLNAAKNHKINRIVFSSSAGIFGELKKLPISEDHDKEPDSPYGNSKLAAENICLIYNKLYNMDNICLRYFNVYGVGQRYDAYGNVIPIFATKALNNELITIYGDGKQTRDFINVKDVVSANILASSSEKGVRGVFNIGSGTRITINLLCEYLEMVAGQSLVVKHGPERPGDVRDSLADISAATKAFGFKPSADILAGLKEYWSWLINDIGYSGIQ